jgi:hypothetical protein
VGFVVDKVAAGQVFSDNFGFPCQFSFHRLLHIHHHLPSGAGKIGQLVTDVPSRLILTPPQGTKKNKTKKESSKICVVNESSYISIFRFRFPQVKYSALLAPDYTTGSGGQCAIHRNLCQSAHKFPLFLTSNIR